MSLRICRAFKNPSSNSLSMKRKTSVWGAEDKATKEYLKKAEIRGRWLNLAAGDGRYNSLLLKKADHVVATDKDEDALARLRASAPQKYEGKLETKVLDATQKFPYADNSFDGVFCTGALHLFPTKVFRRIAEEIGRVVKPRGKVVIDFATDVKRILPNGSSYTVEGEPQYALTEAKKLIRDVFKNYELRMQESEAPEENIEEAGRKYKFSCRFILVEAVKKK